MLSISFPLGNSLVRSLYPQVDPHMISKKSSCTLLGTVQQGRSVPCVRKPNQPGGSPRYHSKRGEYLGPVAVPLSAQHTQCSNTASLPSFRQTKANPQGTGICAAAPSSNHGLAIGPGPLPPVFRRCHLCHCTLLLCFPPPQTVTDKKQAHFHWQQPSAQEELQI